MVSPAPQEPATGSLSSQKPREVNVDDMLPYVGEFGKFQKTTVFVMFLTYFTLGFQVMIVYFITLVSALKICNKFVK